MELLAEDGFDGMAKALPLFLNAVMELERSAFLKAGRCERSEERRGLANGFKPKRVATRAGELELRVSQVRGIAGGGPMASIPARSSVVCAATAR